MKRYAAFLRAINVGGRGIVSMKDLGAAFASAGCANVRTYIASGNVLFDCEAKAVDGAIKKAQRKLVAFLGKEPDIMVRSEEAIERTIKKAPFTSREANAETKLCVVFLSKPPKGKVKVPLVLTKEMCEVPKVTDDAAYVVSRRKPNGSFGFPNELMEDVVGGPTTTRNWNTVIKVAELLRADPSPAPRRTSR